MLILFYFLLISVRCISVLFIKDFFSAPLHFPSPGCPFPDQNGKQHSPAAFFMSIFTVWADRITPIKEGLLLVRIIRSEIRSVNGFLECPLLSVMKSLMFRNNYHCSQSPFCLRTVHIPLYNVTAQKGTGPLFGLPPQNGFFPTET